MISLSQVTKRYPGGHEALRGVSLTVETGEMAFITGHSGAGKSTLLKIMAAIERPTSGSVIVNGQNVGAMRARAVPFLRRKYVFERPEAEVYETPGLGGGILLGAKARISN